MKCTYGMLWLKNAMLRRDLAAFRGRFEKMRKDTALRIAGHIVFWATRPH